ncbi:unnamed protein product [Cuscuta campestris]|uniref:Uncharacterized protein n=1 Tax=Cuscuta campestris TaxID=132261 RepID=A0A484L3A9_9ASTE|nr:unnamed protein product [Cuscuta campestris]
MTSNNHNLTLHSILNKDKLTGSNFLDGQRNLTIVLFLEKKEYVLENAIPSQHVATASRAVKEAYDKHVDDDIEVACLMLATITSELQKHHDNMKAYDMILHLRQLYQRQARHERFQISKALFSCKLFVENPIGPHVLKMIGYVKTLEKLGFLTETRTCNRPYSVIVARIVFFVNYEMQGFNKPLHEHFKMLQNAEESLTKGKCSFIVLVQGRKSKKKKFKKFENKGKGKTKPESTYFNL